MDSAAIPRGAPLPNLIQAALVGALILAAALAWAIAGEQMAGMDAGPGTDPGALGFFVGVWVAMMAAMMFPSTMPMVLMHARIQGGRRARGEAVAGATALFLTGYLVVWALAGVFGYGLYELGKAASGDLFSWGRAGPYLAGAIVLAAAVYQLTPLKDVCLRHCRSPLMFLMSHWRAGRAGSLWMGIAHGGWCVGCCWALMAALFALGVMSIGWMALVAATIATEKLLPWKAVANRGIAVLLVVLGLAVAFAPAQVPGLTLPGSPKALRAMEAMGMEPMQMDSTDTGSMQTGPEPRTGAMHGEEASPPARRSGPERVPLDGATVAR
jgi:predicted metal-binding membrane protein